LCRADDGVRSTIEALPDIVAAAVACRFCSTAAFVAAPIVIPNPESARSGFLAVHQRATKPAALAGSRK
jgi:hypothetical protein